MAYPDPPRDPMGKLDRLSLIMIAAAIAAFALATGQGIVSLARLIAIAG